VILRHVANAIKPSGRLLVAEMLSGPPAFPVVAAMDLGMMVLTRGGRERSRAEFERLLHDAGFELRSVISPTVFMSIGRRARGLTARGGTGGVGLAAAIASAALVKTEVSFSTGMPPLSQTIANKLGLLYPSRAAAPLRISHPVREGRPNPSGLPSLSRPPVRPFIIAPKHSNESDPSGINANKFAYSPRPTGPGPSRSRTRTARRW
jgi:O-methyltransferase domain